MSASVRPGPSNAKPKRSRATWETPKGGGGRAPAPPPTRRCLSPGGGPVRLPSYTDPRVVSHMLRSIGLHAHSTRHQGDIIALISLGQLCHILRPVSGPTFIVTSCNAKPYDTMHPWPAVWHCICSERSRRHATTTTVSI